MIDFVEGVVCEKTPEYLVLNHGGIGLRLNFDPQFAGRLPAVGEEARIYTYLHVREDELSLYAFPEYENKQVFELLLSVSGFGPKISSAASATLSASQFALAILNGDIKTLTQVKGVGKKGAQRLILELQDKLKDMSPELEDGALPAQAAPGGAAEEARQALLVLGYTAAEADAALARVLPRAGDKDVSELVRLSLRELALI